LHIVEVNSNNIEEFSNVLLEAAEWLEAKGQGMWKPEKIEPKELLKQYSMNEMKLCYHKGELIGVFVLQWQDLLFWPEVKDNSSGFFHKLAIKRKYNSMGYGKRLVELAENTCRDKGAKSLKLNCGTMRPKLRGFYESLGFEMVDRVFIDNRDQIRYEKKLILNNQISSIRE